MVCEPVALFRRAKTTGSSFIKLLELKILISGGGVDADTSVPTSWQLKTVGCPMYVNQRMSMPLRGSQRESNRHSTKVFCSFHKFSLLIIAYHYFPFADKGISAKKG